MNQRIVYFLIFVILFNYFKKNEGLNIEAPNVTEMLNKARADALKDKNEELGIETTNTNTNEILIKAMDDAFKKQSVTGEINNSKISLDNDVNIDEQVTNIVSHELENVDNDESIVDIVNQKIDTAISNKNALIIDTDQEEISNEDIVNEATVTINGEEVDTTGGGLNVGIVIFLLFVVVLMMKN